MAKADKIAWTLVDGVYRAICNNRHIWVWRADAGDWRYGTAGHGPINQWQGEYARSAITRGQWDVACDFGASHKHRAMADAITLATVLTPADRPTFAVRGGRNTIGWHFSPAVRAADAAIRRAAEAEESCLRQRAAQYAGMTVDSLEYEIESCESVLDRDSGSEFAPVNRVTLAMLNAELARRLVFRQIAATGDVTLVANV